MASIVYNTAKQKLGDGTLDWDGTGAYRILLLDSTSTYVANADHNFVSDVIGATPGGVEMTGTGYARKDLTSRTVVKDTTNDLAALDTDDVTWTAINAGTAKAALVYLRVGADDTTPADDVLVAHIDSGGFPLTTNGGDLSIIWAAAGVVKIT